MGKGGLFVKQLVQEQKLPSQDVSVIVVDAQRAVLQTRLTEDFVRLWLRIVSSAGG